MDNARKMVLIPAENEIISIIKDDKIQTKKVKDERKSIKKITNIVEIALKLARIKAFNEYGHILGKNGDYIRNSNIANLLEHSMKNGKLLIGENEFIELLHRAGVSEESIFNENIRYKLKNLKTSDITYTEPTVYEKFGNVPDSLDQISKSHDIEDGYIEDDYKQDGYKHDDYIQDGYKRENRLSRKRKPDDIEYEQPITQKKALIERISRKRKSTNPEAFNKLPRWEYN